MSFGQRQCWLLGPQGVAIARRTRESDTRRFSTVVPKPFCTFVGLRLRGSASYKRPKGSNQSPYLLCELSRTFFHERATMLEAQAAS